MTDGRTPPGPDRTEPPEAPGALTLRTDLLGDLQVPGGAARAAELEALASRAALYATRARGPGTRRVYRSAWRGSRCPAAACASWCAAPRPTSTGTAKRWPSGPTYGIHTIYLRR